MLTSHYVYQFIYKFFINYLDEMATLVQSVVVYVSGKYYDYLFWPQFLLVAQDVWNSIESCLCDTYESLLVLRENSGSSRSIGGGEVSTSTFLAGPWVRYPAVVLGAPEE